MATEAEQSLKDAEKRRLDEQKVKERILDWRRKAPGSGEGVAGKYAQNFTGMARQGLSQRDADLNEARNQGQTRKELLRQQTWATKKALSKVKKDYSKGLGVKKRVADLAGAYSQVDLEKDALQFVSIAVAVVADLVGIIPAVGGFISLPFILIIWFLYLINGHFTNRAEIKVGTTALTTFLEIFGAGVLNVLPFYTLNALFNYWLVLAERAGETNSQGQ